MRAAYSSGRPAYGVGPGNVPALIERTANVKKAVADIFAGKTFDYGTICSSEQAIVTEEAIREQVLEECRKQDAYFLSAEEIARLGALVFLGGAHVPNTQVVGRPATTIAEMAGIKVPPSTRVLIAQLDGIGRDVPLSAEKLSPILAFYSAPNLSAAIELSASACSTRRRRTHRIHPLPKRSRRKTVRPRRARRSASPSTHPRCTGRSDIPRICSRR